MEINSTLFVQCVHFIIAYILIKKFLLRPAYMFIKNEHDKRQRLIGLIDKRQEVVANKQDILHTQWQHYVHSFSVHTPDITDRELHLFMFDAPKYRPVMFDSAVIKNETQRIEKSIIQAIRHQYE